MYTPSRTDKEIQIQAQVEILTTFKLHHDSTCTNCRIEARHHVGDFAQQHLNCAVRVCNTSISSASVRLEHRHLNKSEKINEAYQTISWGHHIQTL